MKLVSVAELKPDMVLGKPIYSSDGKLLLGAGVSLSQRFVERLMALGFYSVYVNDEDYKDIIIKDLVSERTRLEARQVISSSLAKVDRNTTLDSRQIKNTVNNLMDELLANRHLLVQLMDIRSIDEKEYTFNHSVNVAVLSLLTGIAKGYNQIQLQELGTGALLHDVGKSGINQDIYAKRDPLTPQEFEEVRTHSMKGFDILRKQNDISLISSAVALQHHERYNGSGYPQGLKGTNIHEYARIVGIADVYDALTSDRHFRKRYYPHQAAEFIMGLAGHYFDPQLVEIFLENIAIYPAGTTVTLSNGQHCIVIDCQKKFPTRPMVRILNPGGYDHLFEINLLDQPSLFIREVENCASYEQKPLNMGS